MSSLIFSEKQKQKPKKIKKINNTHTQNIKMNSAVVINALRVYIFYFSYFLHIKFDIFISDNLHKMINAFLENIRKIIQNINFTQHTKHLVQRLGSDCEFSQHHENTPIYF